MPQPSFEMEESRSVTPWVNRLYFESPRASSFLGLRLVKARHKNLVPLFSGVKPDPMVGSGRYAESIPVKSPLAFWRARPFRRLCQGIQVWYYKANIFLDWSRSIRVIHVLHIPICVNLRITWLYERYWDNVVLLARVVDVCTYNSMSAPNYTAARRCYAGTPTEKILMT